jgi:hypothetical protein
MGEGEQPALELRQRVRAGQREITRAEGGRLWWTGWRWWKRARRLIGRSSDAEKAAITTAQIWRTRDREEE